MTGSELPQGWAVTQLGDLLLAVVGGGTPSRAVQAYFEGAIPWFTVKDMKSLKPSDAEEHISEAAIADSATSLLPPNTLIVATRIALGKAIRPTVACAINQDLKALIPGSGVNPDFLLYWVIANEKSIQELGSGTTVKGIRLETLRALMLALPPASEQGRIVEKLEELLADLDAGVSELRAAQRKLIKLRQSVLEAAFEGDLTAGWRAHSAQRGATTETGAQLLERILRVRRARWEASQLQRFKEQGKPPPKDWQAKYQEAAPPAVSGGLALPEGWQWATIGQCFRVAVGATPSRKEPDYWNGTIPWVSSGEVSFARITQTRERITELGLQNSSTEINPAGSVMLGMIGEGKTRGQVAILDIDAANNQNCAAIRVSETEVPPEYVYFWLWSRYEETRRGSSGNNQPALNKSIVEKILIPLAPPDEMREIVRLVKASLAQVDSQLAAISVALKQAAAQHRNLLATAFSGQLVPQDPSDESAGELLRRIKAERSEQEAQPRSRRTRAKKETSIMVSKLIDVLAEAHDWMPAQEAFLRCGIADGAETDQVEALYAELRALDKSNRLAVEAVTDTQGRKLYDRLRLLPAD